MPVRSLHSSVLVWPDAETVRTAVCNWARQQAEAHPELLAVGYFGSLATGRYGTGSDVDLLLIVNEAPSDPAERHRPWPVETLPVPVDLIVLTAAEWNALNPETRFARMLLLEALWVWHRPHWRPPSENARTPA